MSQSSGRSQTVGYASGSLVGREREFDVLTQALDASIAGDGRLVFLTGEPGMGKTHLASEISQRARAEGMLTAWGRCWEGGGAPAFWPWVQVIRSLIDDLEPRALAASLGDRANELVVIVPEIAKFVPDARPVEGLVENRFALFDAATTFLRSIARTKPLALVLEDLHAADEATLRLLQFVARSLKGSSILVLGTYFEGDARRIREVARLLGELSRDGQRIQLGGLTKEDTAALYRQIADQDAPEAVISVVHDATEGNPFFIHEVVRLLTAEGDLHRPDHSLGFRVPEGAREVVRDRLNPLSDEVRKVVSIASVIGREFTVDTLADVCGLDHKGVLDLLGEAVSAGAIREVSALGRYSFCHALIRETLYEDLTPGDRMRLHSEIAEILETRYRNNPEPHLTELAHHFFKAAQAGDPAKSMDYSLRAAEAAASVMAHEQATRLYQRALKVADLTGVSSAKRAKIMKALKRSEDRTGEGIVEPQEPQTTAEYIFKKEGDYWTLVFDRKTSRLKDIKGLRYLAQLLAVPGRELHSLELVGTEGAEPAGARAAKIDAELTSTGWGDAGAVLDETAKAQYRARLDELQEDLEEAQGFNDPERAARAQEEIDALVQQLAAGVGLGGRDRRAASQVERARMSVSRAVKSAIDKIHEADPALGRHLRTTVKTGIYCSYTPDARNPIPWQL